jgi:hypothetical protein
MVHRRGDAEIAVLIKIVFPFNFGDMFIKLIRRMGLELLDEKKDPVTCADKKVERQGVIKTAFCLNTGGCFGQDRKT